MSASWVDDDHECFLGGLPGESVILREIGSSSFQSYAGRACDSHCSGEVVFALNQPELLNFEICSSWCWGAW